jgi:DNA polymerase-3 subunit delta'
VDRILGQSRAIDALLAALASGRMHHAWIFSGPRGVGKFTAAVELARILLDPTSETDLAGRPVANPSSRTSPLIDAGSHPDLHIIQKEKALYSDNPALRGKKLTNIPLDLLRELMLGGRTSDDRMHEPAAYRTAALNHGKVFIIDEAELLAREAQNALLKTLEEPPAQTFIFLITDQYDQLYPTVRSRCQHVRFRLLDDKAMELWLKRAELDAPAKAMAWIRTFCAGSPGLAKLAAEYKLYEWQQSLDPLLDELDQGRPATELGPALADLVERFAVSWVKKHANASKEAANRDGTQRLLWLLASLTRQRMHAGVANGAPVDAWLELIDVIAHTEHEIDRNVNMKHAFDGLAIEWSELMAHSRAATIKD